MAEDIIAGRPVTITKQGVNVKIVFHPLLNSKAKDPKAELFKIVLSKDDLAKIKKY